MRKSTVALLSMLSVSATAACTASSDEGESGQDAISRPDLKARFADVRKINTDNLARIAVNLGAEGINSALSFRSKYLDLGVDIKPTTVFGAQAEENKFVPADGKVKSLTDIKQGLATDLGENEFPTELAKLRLAHLAKGQDNYYVETGFGLGGAIGLGWGHSAGGFGSAGSMGVSVGFKKGESVESRLIVATPSSSLETLMELNGEAIKAIRGFVLPEKIEHIKAMKPGEMIGLKGKGTFAANFGLGVPLLVAQAGPFAYTIAVSAGLSHSVDGILDVAMVRLEGDEVAVDVGMSEGQVDSASIGIFGGWGVNHLCDDGAACLDAGVGKIVRNALAKQLGGFLRTAIVAGTSKSSNRLELARMRFHMSQPEVPAALEQALHGDLRYAQALYTKNLDAATPPVKFDFDMMRAATTTSRSFGAEIFGIDVFRKSSANTEGSFAVQGPDGVQSVLWNSFQKSSGWFQMDSGSKLTAVSSASMDAKNPDAAVNRANLIVQSVVGDKHMDDDMLLDSTDGLIVMLAGADALAPLDKYGNAMQTAVGTECPVTQAAPSEASTRDTWDEKCNVELIADETRKVVNVEGGLSLVDARKKGVEAFNAQAKVSSLPAEFRKLLASAAELRLTMQMVKIDAVSEGGGPKVSFALNYRLDDKALGLLANVDADKYKDAVRAYLTSVSASRVGFNLKSPPKEADVTKAANAMAALLAPYAARYQALSANESQDLPRILAGKPYVKLPIGIRFDVSDVTNVDSEERMAQFINDEKRIRVESISHQRALLAKDLFDSMVVAVNKNIDFGNTKGRLFKEQAAAYPLLSLISAANLEVGMDVGADTSSKFWAKRERFVKAGFQAHSSTARGGSVEAINGKMFNIDTMMNFTR